MQESGDTSDPKKSSDKNPAFSEGTLDGNLVGKPISVSITLYCTGEHPSKVETRLYHLFQVITTLNNFLSLQIRIPTS